MNARAHRLGSRRKILNNRFFDQYMRLMKILSYRATLDDDDRMAVTTYLLLQDRVEEALASFAAVRPGRLATKLQYDYVDAYLGLTTENLRHSRAVISKPA